MGRNPSDPLPMSGAKSNGLVGRWVSSGGGFGHSVRLPLPLHRVRIEGVGIAGSEGCSSRDQDAVNAARGFAAGAQLDAGGVDALLLREVLRDVEVSLGSSIRGFIGRMLADDNQLGGGLAVESEGDLVEAAFGLVVNTDWPLSVALEGDIAEGCALAGRVAAGER